MQSGFCTASLLAQEQSFDCWTSYVLVCTLLDFLLFYKSVVFISISLWKHGSLNIQHTWSFCRRWTVSMVGRKRWPSAAGGLGLLKKLIIRLLHCCSRVMQVWLIAMVTKKLIFHCSIHLKQSCRLHWFCCSGDTDGDGGDDGWTIDWAYALLDLLRYPTLPALSGSQSRASLPGACFATTGVCPPSHPATVQSANSKNGGEQPCEADEGGGCSTFTAINLQDPSRTFIISADLRPLFWICIDNCNTLLPFAVR